MSPLIFNPTGQRLGRLEGAFNKQIHEKRTSGLRFALTKIQHLYLIHRECNTLLG
jgi:hypothetical protein